MFDVRYAKHVKSEKVLKLSQILIMVGYGVFEGDFSLFINTHVEPGTGTRLKGMVSKRRRSASTVSSVAIGSLFILSRFQLAAQYLQIAIKQRKSYGRLRKSSLVASILPIVASLFWFASFFVIDSKVGSHGFYAARTFLWLTGILVEVMGTFVLRLHKKTGFVNTHLPERFGSLTIIIIGEGVIKLVTVLRDISAGVGFEFKSAIAITASIVSFYLIWAIYFDDFHLHKGDEGFESAGYKWAYMHYLFHMALVLALDGITSLLLFTNIFGGMQSLLNPQQETGIIEDLLNLQNTSLATTAPTTLGKLTIQYNTQNSVMSSLNGTELTQSQYDYVFINLFERIFLSYNVEPSETFMDVLGDLDPDVLDEKIVSHAFNLLLKQFIVSAQFFLIACGMIFITMVPIMMWQRQRRQQEEARNRLGRFVPIAARLLSGVVFLAVAGLADSEGERLGKMLMSGAMIPGFMGTAIILYTLDKLFPSPQKFQ